MQVSSPTSSDAQSEPRLAFWSDWSLTKECSLRPLETLHVASQAFREVGKQLPLLREVRDEALMLVLIFRFVTVLQNEWKPNKRQLEVLHVWWQSKQDERLPADVKVLEMQFHQHGGLLALAAFGFALTTYDSLIKDLNSLPRGRLITVIESIKDYARHKSIDEGLNKIAKHKIREDYRYSFFQRPGKESTREPQPRLPHQPTLEQAQPVEAEAFLIPPAPSQKKRRICGPDENPRDNLNGSQVHTQSTTNGMQQSNHGGLGHGQQSSQSSISQQQIGHHKDQFVSPLQFQANDTHALAQTHSNMLPGSVVLPPVGWIDPTKLTQNTDANKPNIYSAVPSHSLLLVEQRDSEYIRDQDTIQTLLPKPALGSINGPSLEFWERGRNHELWEDSEKEATNIVLGPMQDQVYDMWGKGRTSELWEPSEAEARDTVSMQDHVCDMWEKGRNHEMWEPGEAEARDTISGSAQDQVYELWEIGRAHELWEAGNANVAELTAMFSEDQTNDSRIRTETGVVDKGATHYEGLDEGLLLQGYSMST